MGITTPERRLAPAALDLTASRAAEPAELARRTTPPIKLWALLGGAGLAFELFVLVSWVTGPYFKHVPSGPTAEPGWMRTVHDIWQPAGIAAALFCLYWFIVRPWRRDRTVTTDGLLVAAFATLWFQDPLSAYYGHWFTYNANLVNFGSWVKDVPGWLSVGKPGAMLVEPILLIPAVYVYFIIIGTLLGSWVMRRAGERWPRLSTLQLIGICFLAMAALDFVAEGLIWLPLGFWEYPGGVGLLFPSTYHKFPLNELLTIATIFTAIASLRHFRDDKGRTVVERGIDALRVGTRGQTALRFLAIAGAVHLILFLGYNLPNSVVGAHSRPWPNDLVKRSYFTDYICGQGTDNACPSPGVPLPRGNASAHLGPNGQLVVPAGAKLPKLVPFAH
jgi:hypothetical protein